MTKNENLIITAIEECAELQQALSKVLRFGRESSHPDRPDTNNGVEAIQEYCHVVSMISLLVDEDILPEQTEEFILTEIGNKRSKVLKYRTISCDIGTISEDD